MTSSAQYAKEHNSSLVQFDLNHKQFTRHVKSGRRTKIKKKDKRRATNKTKGNKKKYANYYQVKDEKVLAGRNQQSRLGVYIDHYDSMLGYLFAWIIIQPQLISLHNNRSSMTIIGASTIS